MSKFLKGNYTINKNIVEEENQGKKKKNKFKDEYKKKAIESVGGSMVFIEKDLMVWEGDSDD